MTMLWKTTRYQVDLSQPQVMGIVNVTPDSFSDGGRLADDTAALRHCEQLHPKNIDMGLEVNRPARAAPQCRWMKSWRACCPWCARQ